MQPDLFTADAPSWATLSTCGTYRYLLGRRWGTGAPILWVCLNPSTADADVPDPTVTRIKGFSRSWGYGAFELVNLFAYRATRPNALRGATAIVGPGNDAAITAAAVRSMRVVVAWGNPGAAVPDRVAEVVALLPDPIWQLGTLTQLGQPRHPLYLPASIERQVWRRP
jgi:hypothetical protein